MERGVNIVTNSQPVIVDGADEAIERYNKGEISAQELYDLILDADVVYVDRSNSFEFKESKDINSSEE
jgi:predicted sulfurtransferase